MATKLTRINESDWQKLEEIRKQAVMADGQNRTIADALTVVLDRYDMTAEAIFELSKELVKAAFQQAQEAA